jgi:hypothetical protein
MTGERTDPAPLAGGAPKVGRHLQNDEAAPRPAGQEPRRRMTALGIPRIRKFVPAESVMGHEDAFVRLRLNARYRFRRYVRGPWSAVRPDVQ